jgi:hypothetical protein
VVKQQVQELSPIEVALDEMQMRVNELEEVVFMKPTDAKKLQLRLQVGARHLHSFFKYVVFTGFFLCKSYLIEAPCYKTDGCGFHSLLGHWIFQLTYSLQPQYGHGVN